MDIDFEAAPGLEPGYCGFADRCLTTWLCRHPNYLTRFFINASKFFTKNGEEVRKSNIDIFEICFIM